MTQSDRGIHPDLLAEELTARPSESEPTPRPARGRAKSAVPPEPPAPESEPPQTPAEPAAEGATTATAAEPAPPAEWLEQLRSEQDPEKMLAILTKNLPKDRIARDEVLAGYIGDRVKHGIRDTIAAQERERTERERQEAYQRGDLYTLGQYAATDLQAQEQAQKQQAELQLSPFMSLVQKWQEKLPTAVQAEVSGKTFAPQGTLEEGFLAYLDAVKDASIKHGFDEEFKKREPALRKAMLSSTVGSESTPELESGRSPYIREITDEQIGAMSLEEYNEHFDERGRPKNGIQVRYTRAINPREVQR